MTTPLKKKGCGPRGLGAPNKMISPLKKEDPCWDTHEMVGTKKKAGRTVPNCVPKKKKR